MLITLSPHYLAIGPNSIHHLAYSLVSTYPSLAIENVPSIPPSYAESSNVPRVSLDSNWLQVAVVSSPS